MSSSDKLQVRTQCERVDEIDSAEIQLMCCSSLLRVLRWWQSAVSVYGKRKKERSGMLWVHSTWRFSKFGANGQISSNSQGLTTSHRYNSFSDIIGLSKRNFPSVWHEPETMGVLDVCITQGNIAKETHPMNQNEIESIGIYAREYTR